MLMRSRRRHRVMHEGGFTLPELLVALAAGVVVIFGATGLIIGALHTTSRVTDRVNAVQEGRSAMEELLQELDSGCLANDVSPVQATTAAGISPAVTTDGTHLVFVSGLGDSSVGTPTEHVVSIQNGGLLDVSYANTGGSPPALGTPATWTFSATPARRSLLLDHVAQINVSTPLFQFYSYSNASNATANSLVGAVPVAVPLGATTAPAVAQVDISWLVAPSDGLTDVSRVTAMRDSQTFRLTPADPVDLNYPCD
jgi:prepilin-type N-terminal cleavage/methylation domain-containing protein